MVKSLNPKYILKNMVQPVQLKTHDSYKELQEQRDQIDQSWTLQEIANHILDQQENPEYIKDGYTLISLAHQKYKENYIQRTKNDGIYKADDPYLNLKQFYQAIQNTLEPDKNSEIAQRDKINQFRDIILAGELQYQPKNNSLNVHIQDNNGETQIKYEGPSKPEQISNKK